MAGDEKPSVALEELQGEWKASRGEAVVIVGKEISINGRPMPGGLKLSADGARVVGFSIYGLRPGQAGNAEQICWQAGAQEIIWRRAAAGEVQDTVARMTSAITSQGEGLAAATLGHASEHALVVRLNELLERWRVGPLVSVRSCDVCPDWTNRAQTGLSLDHVHYVAAMIGREGFRSRRRGWRTEQGAHDVPVLVREKASSPLGRAALDKWRAAVANEPAFPPFLLEGRSAFFCSLGNGHFSQALNLFRTRSRSLWTGQPYEVGGDDALREALDEGVDSLVLSCDMPAGDRKFVSEMLNRAHGRQWNVGDDGQVSIEGDIPSVKGSQFIALSKVLDAEELSTLVRVKLGVDVNRKAVGAEHGPSSRL